MGPSVISQGCVRQLMTMSAWAQPQPGCFTHACMRPAVIFMASTSLISGPRLLYRRWRDISAKLGGGGSAGRELGQLLQGIGELLVSEEAAGQVCFLLRARHGCWDRVLWAHAA